MLALGQGRHQTRLPVRLCLDTLGQSVLELCPCTALTLQHSLGLPQRVLQPAFGDPPQPDLGIFPRCSTETTTERDRQGVSGDAGRSVPRQCDSAPQSAPWAQRTYQQRGAVGQRGPSRGRPPPCRSGWWARLCRGDGPAWRAGGEQRVTQSACQARAPMCRAQRWHWEPLPTAVPRGRRSGRQRRAAGGRRAGGWRRSRRSRPAW